MSEIVKAGLEQIGKQLGDPKEADKPSNTVITSFCSQNIPEGGYKTIRHYLNWFYADKIIAKICYLIGTIALILQVIGFFK